MHEAELAHPALGHDASGNGNLLIEILQLFRCLVAVKRAELSAAVCACITFAVGINALLTQRCHLLTAYDLLIVQFFFIHFIIVLCHTSTLLINKKR